ncbi:LexA family transcriptional regulator [Salinicola sp. DM10]|uniref:LexA family protein n=1 Tax=Salinicola sp. DM10 TaxID=2815721 RepID=UPI001A90A58C|nr:translesion error-prone DNA polymerase V autoproteolytic subunit [Salinicola sp. DM10]MCE3025708.1 translesion error-prone DNA polymerase V autoproteolytic subunit [Salinicola sp. DM10]
MSRIQLIGQAPSSPPRLDIPCPEVLARAGIAGFASPAEDYAGRSFDLNERFIKHQAATFIFQVAGDSMEEYRIYEGDFLVVDRSITPRPGHIVVALVEGELTVKKWITRGQWELLCSGGDRYPPIPMNDVETQIWGVVRSGHVEFCV